MYGQENGRIAKKKRERNEYVCFSSFNGFLFFVFCIVNAKIE